MLRPLQPLRILEEPYARTPAEACEIRCIAGDGPPEVVRAGDGWGLIASLAECDGAAATTLASFAGPGGKATAALDAEGAAVVPFSLAAAYDNYVHEAGAGSRSRRLTERQLNLYYRLKQAIPRAVQLSARRALIRLQGAPAFPRWPYDAGVASLARFTLACALAARGARELEFVWFWPSGKRAAFILTHDVESGDGLRNAASIADLEESLGFRSSFNVVGDWYPIDRGLLDDLQSRGFEIGVHGWHHDRSLFSSREMFQSQLPLLRDTVEAFDASGFRSPATHRVLGWLEELPVEYDCTMPLSDPYEPQPGGCCSPWPFFLGRIVELPYTLPQDHTLFTLLGHTDTHLWEEQAERLIADAGLIQCLSHPDPGYLGEPANRDMYRGFLERYSEDTRIWHALPREVARWWRYRDGCPAQSHSSEFGSVDLGVARLADGGAVELIAPELG